MSQPLNILAVGAHPDDFEILCAGTLAKYAQAGHKIFMCVFTSGNMGDATIEPVELARLRLAEQQASADLIGATLIWPGIDDEHVDNSLAQRRIMIDVLRQADPDVIITHSPNDYHPDHRYVSQLVFDSYFQKGLKNIPLQTQPACRFGVAPIYYMDNVSGIDFIPTEYVDITDVIETKKQMLLCHQTQVRAMEELAKTDLIDLMLVHARFRALGSLRAGCKYAEGFRRLEASQRGLVHRVLP